MVMPELSWIKVGKGKQQVQKKADQGKQKTSHLVGGTV